MGVAIVVLGTLFLLLLPFAPFWGPYALRAICEIRREKTEALDLLVDLVEIEADYLEEWDTRSPDGRVSYIYPNDTLWHKSGEFKIGASGYSGPKSYELNGIPLTGRGLKVAKRLFDSHARWREQQKQIAELDRVTRALRA